MSHILVILMVFVIAYGAALQAILYPNSTLGWPLLGAIFKKAFFHIDGEHFLDELDGQWLFYSYTRNPFAYFKSPSLFDIIIICMSGSSRISVNNYILAIICTLLAQSDTLFVLVLISLTRLRQYFQTKQDRNHQVFQV